MHSIVYILFVLVKLSFWSVIGGTLYARFGFVYGVSILFSGIVVATILDDAIRGMFNLGQVVFGNDTISGAIGGVIGASIYHFIVISVVSSISIYLQIAVPTQPFILLIVSVFIFLFVDTALSSQLEEGTSD